MQHSLIQAASDALYKVDHAVSLKAGAKAEGEHGKAGDKCPVDADAAKPPLLRGEVHLNESRRALLLQRHYVSVQPAVPQPRDALRVAGDHTGHRKSGRHCTLQQGHPVQGVAAPDSARYRSPTCAAPPAQVDAAGTLALPQVLQRMHGRMSARWTVKLRHTLRSALAGVLSSHAHTQILDCSGFWIGFHVWNTSVLPNPRPSPVCADCIQIVAWHMFFEPCAGDTSWAGFGGRRKLTDAQSDLRAVTRHPAAARPTWTSASASHHGAAPP